MYRNRFGAHLLRRIVSVAICVVFSLSAPVSASGQNLSIGLGETLFVSEKKDVGRDHDGDSLKDDLEYRLAEQFKPLLIFDSDESARRPNEPTVLFQVRPSGCIGVGCPLPYSVNIQYAFLWQRDGGYGPSSDCFDAHHGDNQGMVVHVRSDDGQYWTIDHVSIGDEWPGHAVQWYQGSHVVVYMSAHKHHQYFDTSNDEEDSPASCCGCNDDVNGKGTHVSPNLVSPYPDHRVNNVGEPEARVRKCLEWKTVWAKGNEGQKCVKWTASISDKYFIGPLDAFAYPGEHAWGKKPFCGGLSCDSDETSSMESMWLYDQFHFTGKFQWDNYDTLGGLKGRIVDSNGKPIPGVKLYYRPFDLFGLAFGCCTGPWDSLPVGVDGSYEVRVPLVGYLLRPVASDYNFKDVPKAAPMQQGSYVVTDFVGTKITEGPRLAYTENGIDVAALDARSANRVFTVSIPSELKELIFTVAAPSQMVQSDSRAADGGKAATDPFVELPRRFTLSFHVNGVLDDSGNPAQTSADIGHLPATVIVDQFGQKHIKSGPVRLVPAVEGARIQARLVGGENRVDPHSSAWIEVTTNSKGNAYLILRSGVHPGTALLEVRLVSHPVNPWAVFSLSAKTIELQPAVHGGDSTNEPRLALVQAAVDERQVPYTWWKRSPAKNSVFPASRQRALAGDVNLDRVVNANDLTLVQRLINKHVGQPGFKAAADLNNDGVIDAKDLAIVQQNMGRKFTLPVLSRTGNQ